MVVFNYINEQVKKEVTQERIYLEVKREPSDFWDTIDECSIKTFDENPSMFDKTIIKLLNEGKAVRTLVKIVKQEEHITHIVGLAHTDRED